MTDLRTVLSQGLAPAQIYGLTLQGGATPRNPLWLLVTARQDHFVVVDGISETDLMKLRPEAFSAKASLPIGDWSVWENATLPAEAVRILLSNVKLDATREPEWTDIIRAAERQGVRPVEVLKWIEGQVTPGIHRQTNE